MMVQSRLQQKWPKKLGAVKNKSHTLAYSLVALQEMNLAFHFPIIFWNCACLICDSAGNEEDIAEVDDYVDPVSCVGELVEEETDDDEDDDESEEVASVEKKKKKKTSTTNYGKVSTAINKMKNAGVSIEPPDVNASDFTFVPDVDNNTIIYGLSGIVKIGAELVSSIIDARPYASIEDFLSKVKINKTQMVNLIKAGAFDKFGSSREEVMEHYVSSIADQKKELNLRNMQMLIGYNLLPEELSLEVKIFNFQKYLKKNCKDGLYYKLEDYPLEFYKTHFDEDAIIYENDDCGRIDASRWDKTYTKLMNPVRDYIKAHKEELLTNLNNILYQEVYNKYCLGSISKWEMDSVSYYNHPHELAQVDQIAQGWADFNRLPEEPEPEYTFTTKDGKTIPMFHIERIAGTVLDRDKTKRLITILTTTGVVTIRMFGDAFTKYDRQISERGADGKKHVIEPSMFKRGNKIIISGIRRGSTFIAKKYTRTPWHLVETIDEILPDGQIITRVRE